MKTPIVIAALVLAILATVSVGNFSTVAAQDESDEREDTILVEPGRTLRVSQGPGQDELTVSWDAVAEAKFYRVGWVAYKDYLAAKAAGEDWRDSITYRSIANNDTTSYAVGGLTPGDKYWFIVGSSSERYDKPEWSPWSSLVTLLPPCLGDRDALVALYNSTNGPRWRNNVNWLSE